MRYIHTIILVISTYQMCTHSEKFRELLRRFRRFLAPLSCKAKAYALITMVTPLKSPILSPIVRAPFT